MRYIDVEIYLSQCFFFVIVIGDYSEGAVDCDIVYMLSSIFFCILIFKRNKYVLLELSI